MVPRRHPQPRLAAVAVPLPAARVPLRPAGRGERAVEAGPPRPRARAPRHRRSSTTTATGSSTSPTPRPRRPTCSCASGSRTPDRSARSSTSCPRCGSATRGRGTSTRPSRCCGPTARRQSPSTTTTWARSCCGRGPGRRRTRPACCSARTRPTPRCLFDSPATTPFPKDGINDHVLHGTATVNPDGEGTKASAWYEVEVDPGQTVELRLRLTEAGVEAADAPGDLAGASRRSWPSARPRPTSSTPSWRRPRRRRRRSWSCARRSPACSGASSSTTTTWPAGWPATPPSPRPRSPAGRGATPCGATWRPSTSSPCRTSGSTRGSRRGTSPSIPSPWPTSTRPSPSTSCWSCAGSGSSTPTGRSPPTSGTSTTSTRPSTPGPPSRSSGSTASATSTSSSGCS